MDNFKLDAGQFTFDITVFRSLGQASIQWVPAAPSSVVRRLECEADRLPQSRVRRTHLLCK